MKILSTTPTRISLFGGGTDVDPYARQYGGICVNFAINIYQRMVLFNGDDAINVKNIFPEDGDKKYIQKILKEFNLDNLYSIGTNKIRIQSYFDGYIGAGLGSSASCAVALIGAVNKLRTSQFSQYEIIQIAWDIETNKIGKYGGKQDQCASTFGGANVFRFVYGKINRQKIIIHEKILNSLILFYIGNTRKSDDIQKNFKELTPEKKLILDQIKSIAEKSIVSLKEGNIKKIVELLNQSWELKKKSNTITNDRVDIAYQIGIEAGAMAGKLLGAGQGGYMLFLVDQNRKKEFIDKMNKKLIKSIDYSVCYNGLQTRIL